MKRIILITTALFFVMISITAQDFIYLRNHGDRIEATNVQVQHNKTTYSIFGNDPKQIFSIENDNISLIAFENGDLKFFEIERNVSRKRNFKKNLINYHLFDLVVNNFKLSYERIIANGKVGIQIPFAIGYADEYRISGYDNAHNKFYTGLSVNFYPTGQGGVRYFMGPGIQIGNGYFTSYYESTGQHVNDNLNTFIFRFLVNNGIMFTPIEALSISIVGSLGIRYTDKTPNQDNSDVTTVGAFSTNLSYRF
jgi:hypothetical protein